MNGEEQQANGDEGREKREDSVVSLFFSSSPLLLESHTHSGRGSDSFEQNHSQSEQLKMLAGAERCSCCIRRRREEGVEKKSQ